MGDLGSKLLYKARTGTLEVNGRRRDGQDQSCNECEGVKETVEHVIVECERYEEERRQLVTDIINIIGEEEWTRRLEEEDGAITTALGLYEDSRKETDRLIKCTKKFLLQIWEKRQSECEE